MGYATFEEIARDFGIKSVKPLRHWIDVKNRVIPVNDAAMVNKTINDAALITTPNSTIPAEFTSYLSTEVVNILTAPRVATEIFPEIQYGDWTTSNYQYEVRELTGETEPYGDYADAGMSDINREWVKREQYVFQTNITVGDREADISAAARLNLIASKQESAANTIAMDMNRFQMLGIQEMDLYGILNDPNRPAAIAAAPVGTGSSTLWADKSMLQIYNDIVKLFEELAVASMGWITPNDQLKLLLSPQANVQLARATDYNTSVMDLVNKYLTNLTIIVVPELHSTTAGETIMMIAPTVNGQQTGRLPISERYRANAPVRGMSSVAQKVIAGMYGVEIRIGFGIATMTDV